jgi:hypothetical protein
MPLADKARWPHEDPFQSAVAHHALLFFLSGTMGARARRMMWRYRKEALRWLPAVPSSVTQTSRGTPARRIAATRLRFRRPAACLACAGRGFPARG